MTTDPGTPPGRPAAARSAVIVNPSKVLELDERRREICAALAEAGWPEPLWLETTRDDPGCGQTERAISEGAGVVFAFGGDGTVMAVASVLAGTDVALAVLPSGTGNLLAANVGLPDDVTAGVAVATEGHRRRIDVGAVEEHRFTVMAGMGFDAKMVGDAPEPVKKRLGWPAYVLSALKHLRDRPVRVRISLDGARPLRRRARMVLVANVGRLQGGLLLLPDASPDDGRLDVAVISPRTLAHWLRLGWAVIRRRHEQAQMEVHRAERVQITWDREQPREVDGDVIGASRTMTVSVMPRALVLCVPAPAGAADLAQDEEKAERALKG